MPVKANFSNFIVVLNDLKAKTLTFAYKSEVAPIADVQSGSAAVFHQKHQDNMYFRKKLKITKNRYLAGFSIVVLALAFIRLVFPSVAVGEHEAGSRSSEGAVRGETAETDTPQATDTARIWQAQASPLYPLPVFFGSDGKAVRHRINSVPGFSRTFPDNNDVQLQAAQAHGVQPVEDRAEAERRKKDLVFVGASPYFHVDPLSSSIPYLVPRAANLLSSIGRAFYDSLQIKGIPLHQVIVTSVLRTRSDVKRLRTRNANATENSCHLYGTTFDIGYNRYKTVSPAEGSERRPVRNDTLKWVLSEVLRDMRQAKRCYVKYEVKQGCFHITAR